MTESQRPSQGRAMTGGPFITYVAERLHFVFGEAVPARALMTRDDLRHRLILRSGDVWDEPVWPLDPSQPRPPAPVPAAPHPIPTPPPSQPSTSATTPSCEAGPSRVPRRASSRPVRPRPIHTPPAPPSVDVVLQQVQADQQLILAFCRTICDHFHIPHPVIQPPTPAHVSPVPSPRLSPALSPVLDEEEEDEEAVAAQFVVAPHEEEIGLSIDDIDRSAALEGGDVEMDEAVEDDDEAVEDDDEAAEDDDEVEDDDDEADDEDDEEADDDDDEGTASGSPAASS